VRPAELGLVDRHYRRRKRYPGEIERLNREARTAALLERSGEQIAFESPQIQLSQEMQRAAARELQSALSAMGRIARGAPSVGSII